MIDERGGQLSRLLEEEKEPAMCDYSLHLVASRPAKVGDRLVTTKFTNAITRGFAAVGEPNVAVCLLPGTEVAFENEVECDHAFRRLLPGMRFGKLAETVARFRQVNVDCPNTHHDALEFPSGQIVLIARLCEGQRAVVLQLPACQGNAREVPLQAVVEESAQVV